MPAGARDSLTSKTHMSVFVRGMAHSRKLVAKLPWFSPEFSSFENEELQQNLPRITSPCSALRNDMQTLTLHFLFFLS